MSFFKSNLIDIDKDIADSISNELNRQRNQIELIAVSYTHLRAHET